MVYTTAGVVSAWAVGKVSGNSEVNRPKIWADKQRPPADDLRTTGAVAQPSTSKLPAPRTPEGPVVAYPWKDDWLPGRKASKSPRSLR